VTARRRKSAILTLGAEIDAKANLCRDILNLAFTPPVDHGPDGVTLYSRAHGPGELEAVIEGLGIGKPRH
jgi:hypothetical protein